MKNNKAGSLDLPVAQIPAAVQTGRASATDRWLARQMLALLGNPALLVVLWDGEEITTSDQRPSGRLYFRDRGALYKLLFNPDLHFGDLYSVGRIEIEGNLVEMLEATYFATQDKNPLTALKKFRSDVLNRTQRNSLAGSRHNIHHHYDLGNDFYELWLDAEAMQYTCAYFPSPTLTLEQAQCAKMDHICRKLQLKPGDSVIEAGCGWGGLARHMARHYGVKVRSYNISREQLAYAHAKTKQEGLSDRVEYIEDDYRNISGSCNVFVSIGMLEHVGKDHYRGLGEMVSRVLTEDGRGLIHSIGRNKPEKMNAWIEKRIFPGAYPPTLKEMMEIFDPNGFSVLDIENLRLHYAKTLEQWLARFERHRDRIENLFDAYFVRAWRLYLTGSLAAFATGSLQLFQVAFTRDTNNQLAWSRAHLYRGDRAGELHGENKWPMETPAPRRLMVAGVDGRRERESELSN
jgi:cyclopropane-fatty-acyl-phospholipid synthase